MKKTILFFFLFSLLIRSNAQWQPLGTYSTFAVSGFDMALDTAGLPAFVYRDSYNQSKASVQIYNDHSWGFLGSAGFSNSDSKGPIIAYNSLNQPFVAFFEAGGKASVMAYKNNTWQYVGTPEFTLYSATFISLSFDAYDTLYMGFRDFMYGARTSVMKYTGSDWQYVGKPGFSAGNTSSLVAFGAANIHVKISPSGILYVSYSDQPNGYKASVMKFEDTAWVYVGSPGFSAGAANFTRLDFDTSGVPYVAYTDGGNGGKATVMRFDSTIWNPVAGPGITPATAENITLKFDRRTNIPYLGFKDYGNDGKTSVMKFDGSKWQYVGDPGFSQYNIWYGRLDIDKHGNLFFGYVEENPNTLFLQPVVMKYINENAVSLKKEFSENGLQVYPNPTEKFISICYKSNLKSDNLELKIKNTIGQCIYSKSCKIPGAELNERIDLSHFPKGIYFIQISAGNATEVRKIVLE